jgi:hypothetical protein
VPLSPAPVSGEYYRVPRLPPISDTAPPETAHSGCCTVVQCRVDLHAVGDAIFTSCSTASVVVFMSLLISYPSVCRNAILAGFMQHPLQPSSGIEKEIQAPFCRFFLILLSAG